jgi:hypothetical protein
MAIGGVKVGPIALSLNAKFMYLGFSGPDISLWPSEVSNLGLIAAMCVARIFIADIADGAPQHWRRHPRSGPARVHVQQPVTESVTELLPF